VIITSCSIDCIIANWSSSEYHSVRETCWVKQWAVSVWQLTQNTDVALLQCCHSADCSEYNKAVLSQRRPHDVPYIWVPSKLVSPTNIPIETNYVNIVTSQGDNIQFVHFIKKSTPIYSILLPMSRKGVTSCNDGRTIRPQGTRKTHVTYVFPKFLQVPLRVGRWPSCYEERRCWANCSRN